MIFKDLGSPYRAPDAAREVRKYSSSDQTKDANLHPNMLDHRHMRLFRAQRNLYISGFCLLLWLVMNRLTALINQLATTLSTSAALQTQVESTKQAAKKYMEDNELLKQAKRNGAAADPHRCCSAASRRK